jgi:LAO/AO transport system kinase
VAVAGLADVVVLLLQPESGDDLQWEKAGILELADIVVIHKADLPGAEQTAAQVRSTLELSPGRTVPVLLVSTKKSLGQEELWQAIEGLPPRRRPSGTAQLLQLAQDLLARRLREALGRGDVELTRVVNEWTQGSVASDDAAERLLQRLAAPTR